MIHRETPVNPQSPRSRRILLVDDEEFFLFSASLALKRSGYRVTSAGDGQEALEAVLESLEGQDPIHLLVTDILMPRLDGFGLLDRLAERGIEIPALVITGFLDPEAREALQVRGCEGALEKPFTPVELISMVDRLLGRGNNPSSGEETASEPPPQVRGEGSEP